MAKDFWVIDAETDPFKFKRVPKPFIWGAYNGRTREYIEFEKTSDLVAFMRPQNAIFYAHNGGKFDFHFMAEWLNQNEKILMINSRLVKAKIGQAELRDSYALLPFPLKSYKKDDIDYTKLEEKVRHLHMPEIRAYLKSDCVYLWDLLAAFFEKHGRHLTAPGAAIKTLMKMEGIKIENSGQAFFDEFRKHYFGGRCECVSPGSIIGDEITYLDINSAYPYAMLHAHPIGSDWEFSYYKSPPIIPQGFYTVEAESYGAFCYRDKMGLHFDRSGERRLFHTTGWELKAAIETGTAKNITHVEQKFFAETKSFEKFINHFWDERNTHERGTPDNLFAKLFMNACYGKFCADPTAYDEYFLFDPRIGQYLVSNEWELRGEIGPHLVASKPLEAEFMRFYNVATGASITGFVRSMLLRALSSIDEPLYCDTDSIIYRGNSGIEIGNGLGQWKVEGIFNEGHFAGKKLYAVRDKEWKKSMTDKEKSDHEKISCKGVRLNFDQIKKVAGGKTLQYQQEALIFSCTKNIHVLERNIRRTA